jgi:hypothetical protein
MTDGNASRGQALGRPGRGLVLAVRAAQMGREISGLSCRQRQQEMTGSGGWLTAAFHRGETESTATSVPRPPSDRCSWEGGSHGSAEDSLLQTVVRTVSLCLLACSLRLATISLPSQTKPAGVTLETSNHPSIRAIAIGQPTRHADAKRRDRGLQGTITPFGTEVFAALASISGETCATSSSVLFEKV